MKKVFISQSNYIPWKGYFDAINLADEFIIFDDMQFTKRDWRNRNKIKTKNGVQWISIPVEVKGNYHQKINETHIAEQAWAENHWNSIIHNYSKASCFHDYRDIFQAAYSEVPYPKLSDVNFHFIKTICKILGIKTKIRWSTEFQLLEGKTERLVDLCRKTGAAEYLTGGAARAYLNESLFAKENISIKYLDYSGYPAYNQLFGEFVHEVSILDLIFNEGKNAKKFMKSFALT